MNCSFILIIESKSDTKYNKGYPYSLIDIHRPTLEFSLSQDPIEDHFREFLFLRTKLSFFIK